MVWCTRTYVLKNYIVSPHSFDWAFVFAAAAFAVAAFAAAALAVAAIAAAASAVAAFAVAAFAAAAFVVAALAVAEFVVVLVDIAFAVADLFVFLVVFVAEKVRCILFRLLIYSSAEFERI